MKWRRLENSCDQLSGVMRLSASVVEKPEHVGQMCFGIYTTDGKSQWIKNVGWEH